MMKNCNGCLGPWLAGLCHLHCKCRGVTTPTVQVAQPSWLGPQTAKQQCPTNITPTHSVNNKSLSTLKKARGCSSTDNQAALAAMLCANVGLAGICTMYRVLTLTPFTSVCAFLHTATAASGHRMPHFV